MPEEKLISEMATYHEELAKPGALLDASGLQPSSKGWRIEYSGGKRTVIDGPFAETKELIAGYWLWQVKSKEERRSNGSSAAPIPTTKMARSKFASYSRPTSSEPSLRLN